MIIKHESRTIIQGMSTEQIVKFLVEMNDTLSVAIRVLQTVTQVEDGAIDEFELLDELELISGEQHTVETINLAANVREPINDVVASYLKRTVFTINNWMDNISIIVNSGCAPSLTEQEVLKQGALTILSGLSYIAVFDFSIQRTLETAAAGSELAVDEGLYTLCKVANKAPIDVATNLYELYKTYPIKFTWFESYPELEDAFIDTMGPYYTGIDEDMLTEELVRKVLSGEISPSDVIASLLESKEEE